MKTKRGQKALVLLLTLSFLGIGAAPASAFCASSCCFAPQSSGHSYSGAAHLSNHRPFRIVGTDRCCFLQEREGAEALAVSRPHLPKAERTLLRALIPLSQGITAPRRVPDNSFVCIKTSPDPLYLWNSSLLI